MDIFDLSLTIKKRKHYLEIYTTASYDWALPLRVELESMHTDYFEFNIQLLCFYFSYTTTSEEWEQISSEYFRGKENDEPQETT